MPKYYGVKEAVFPFNMFQEVDPVFGPEMRSTGEVLGLSTNCRRGLLQGTGSNPDKTSEGRHGAFFCQPQG